MKNDQLQPTAVNQYFEWLEKTVNPNTALHNAAKEYLEKARIEYGQIREKMSDAPFLSIITRTQGKRPQMLTETLLCLTGQTNTDFELLIMGHNLTEEQHKTVSGIIEDQPEWMRQRIRIIPVSGGTRTTPLNRGFEEAKGRYIAVLDDDDLVFDHWVEAFYELAKENDGKILHSYTLIQDWETVSEKMPDTPRAANAPSDIYCQNFKMLDELTLNRCPLCALAFPSYVFHTLGIHFDERLTTTEDWDYLMRCSFLVGVADSPDITFLYRNWLNAENSATLHGKDEWKKNYTRIVENFVNTPILFPAGSMRGMIDKNLLDDEEASIHVPREQELFFDDGEDFSHSKLMYHEIPNSAQLSSHTFTMPEKYAEAKICRLRFDPQFYGFCTVKELKICVLDTDGNQTEFTVQDMDTNGYRIENRVAFLKNDPQFLINFKTPITIREVQVECRLRHYISDADLDYILHHAHAEKRSLVYRGLRKIYRISKRLVKK